MVLRENKSRKIVAGWSNCRAKLLNNITDDYLNELFQVGGIESSLQEATWDSVVESA